MELGKLINLSKEKSLDELVKTVEQEITSVPNYQISMWENFAAPVLYRARKHNHLYGNSENNILHHFESESEFWNTPPEISPLGRCQNKGESLLYCSTSWETAISEVRPNAGDFVSVSIYHAGRNAKNPNTFLGSRIIPIGVQYLSQIEHLKHMFQDYDFKGRDEEFYKLDTFLDDLFHANVGEKNQYLYNLSIAVTRCMMKNIFDGEVERQMHGMIYSSIVKNKMDYNLVLRPNHARTIYKLNQVQTFQIFEITESSIKLQLTRNGYTFGEKKHVLDFFEMYWTDINDGPIDEIELTTKS
jgi:hypothetical protein